MKQRKHKRIHSYNLDLWSDDGKKGSKTKRRSWEGKVDEASITPSSREDWRLDEIGAR